MSNAKSPVGQAWRSHVVGRDDSAVKEFERIVSETPEDLDALYGLALAQRGAGQHSEALANFQHILEKLDEQTSDENADRTEMLKRMVQQQIAFLEG